MIKLNSSKFSLVILIAAVFVCSFIHSADAQTQTVGLFLNDTASYDGYTVFVSGATAVMIDNYGRLVHTWNFPYSPGGAVYLLDNGLLLWFSPPNSQGNRGAHILKSDWDGNTVWEWKDTNSAYLSHHDIEPLPNGNVLVLARDFIPLNEVIAAGRDTAGHSYDTVWSEMIFEIEPTGPTSGDVVWEWRAWDHLVQDFDSTLSNYDTVENHPELIDLNFTNGAADWLHSNGIGYSSVLDQIVMSHRTISEIWVIDHSTTTAEAAGHSGGNNNMGGDLIYRWGNPVAYRGGDSTNQTLFKQHNSQWIAPGLPGEGHLLIFNNGNDRGYSSADEILTPVDLNGEYPLPSPGTAHGPSAPIWTFFENPPESLYAGFISGTQRLPNGNTLICEGPSGDFREVDSLGNLVWRYIKATNSGGPVNQGDPVVGNGAFRCTRYGIDHPGLQGQELIATGPIEIYPISIQSTAHSPKIPSPLDPTFTVTTSITAPAGITAVELFIDTGAGFIAETMYDDGAHEDGAADDDIYGATPSVPSDSTILIEYYIKVEDHNTDIVTDPPNPPATVYRVQLGILCGNINGITGSGPTDILDLTFIVNYIFRQGPPPPSLDAANVNGITSPGGTKVDILDLTYVVNYLFRNGPAPVCE